MYNTVTENLIKSIPQVGGFDNEVLPQSLTRVYARIISLKTKYGDGTIQFGDYELEQDYQRLEGLSSTLELFLISKTNEESRKAIAYVAATGRKLMGLIRLRQEKPLTLDYIPEDLYASLLYVISGSLADAREMSDGFPKMVQNQVLCGDVLACYKKLVSGWLSSLIDYKEALPRTDNPIALAEDLLWKEMINGMKQLASYLRDGVVYNHKSFLRIESLSKHKVELGQYSRSDIYTGALVLSKLMMMSAEELVRHALIRIEAPQGVNPKDWAGAMKQQISFKPYLWDNHIDAIRKGVLNIGTSAVITFPTGSGKTTLSELKITACLLTGKDVVYLVPTHALEYQVFQNMKRLLGRINDPKTINRDGEFSDFEDEEQDNPIHVMTPEHCLTMISVNPELFKNVGLVVFDEFHLMSGDEKDNRAVDAMLLMTELLTQIPSADYLLMSAMVSNGDEVAQWIAETTERQCLILDDPWKPTSQLQGCIVYNASKMSELVQLIKSRQRDSKQKTPPKSLQDKMIIQPECLFSLKTIWDTMDVRDYYLSEILDHNIALAVGKDFYGKWQLSANYNKVAAELAAKYAAIGLKTIIFALDPKSANSINKSLTEKVRADKTSFLFAHYHGQMDMIALELGGIEYSYLTCCKSATLHHANLLPEERNLSENYFMHKDGVAVMVATPTIAQGINLPADVVLIAGSSRYDSESNGMEHLDAHEILNAAGRAGRAGFRSHGTAILIPSKPIGFENNRIDSIWKDIKDEIFSKGDRCLDVSDPLGGILNLIDDDSVDPVLYKLQDDEVKLRKRLGNSFYAYKMHKEGRASQLNIGIDKLVGIIGRDDCNDSQLKELATRIHIDEDTITRLLNVMTERDAQRTLDMSVIGILGWIKELLIDSCDIIDKLLGNKYAELLIRKTMGMGENQLWDKFSVEQLFAIVEAYISGASLLDIENRLTTKLDVFLKNARVFVIKVIPSISYMCGIIIQVLLAWLEKRGVTREDCPNDLRVFASCVKEGVFSYDMLMVKYRGRQMRVECHNKYQG